MDRTVLATVSLNTNSQVVGRYFIDVRDTTHSEPGRQMTTRVTNTPADFIRELTAEGIKQGVIVSFLDTTAE